mmetsp:Transcript_12280/g.36171  ORF Transcript_12280/g.36171 Transcript_12280/m.36171 type:complete len:203 (-) Transcript_12280:535-1143(-)
MLPEWYPSARPAAAQRAALAHQRGASQNPRYFKDLGLWAVRAPSKQLAQKMHAAILAAPGLRETAKRLNPELDVSPMDNPAVKPLEFTLARSATQFETKKKGLLPPSHVMMGKNTYDVKDYQDPLRQRRVLGPPLPRPARPEEHHQDSLGGSHCLPNFLDWHPRRLPPHARRDGHRGGSRRGGRRQRRGGRAGRQRARRRRG